MPSELSIFFIFYFQMVGAIVLFSGLGDNAQEELDVGIGALAGSTIMLLTIPYVSRIFWDFILTLLYIYIHIQCSHSYVLYRCP